ncbi:MAG: DUF5627 domain-containing protein [Muribaculum sp.]|nr:DUF5627 domain-containing protein [Muribaculum sp.]
MKKSLFAMIAVGMLGISSCKNSDIDFPDYIYQTIYFAQQSPIRTIVLGEDGDFDTELDNKHQFQVMATLGGINGNNKTRTVDVKIAPELLNGVTFAGGSPIKLLPENYYTMESKTITIAKGQVRGGTVVQLSDAFFADIASTEVTYVLPMILVNGSDSILEGQPGEGILNPNRYVSSDWEVAPMDYQLLAIKYKNPYHGVWLSQGKDEVTVNGTVTTTERKQQYWEKADTCWMSTVGLNVSRRQFSPVVQVINAAGEETDLRLNCTLHFTINDNGDVSVSTPTTGCSASGSGKWTYHGAKKAWADKDRDQITVNYEYEIPYVANELTNAISYYKVKREETLVMRDRQSKFETFSFTYNQ